MAPIVHGLETEYKDRINFVYLDIDDPRNETFKRDLGYRVQPHFLLIDGDGSIIQQWIGPVPEETFQFSFDLALMK